MGGDQCSSQMGERVLADLGGSSERCDCSHVRMVSCLGSLDY